MTGGYTVNTSPPSAWDVYLRQPVRRWLLLRRRRRSDALAQQCGCAACRAWLTERLVDVLEQQLHERLDREIPARGAVDVGQHSPGEP